MVGFYNYTVWLTYISLISGASGIALTMMYPGKPILAILCLLLSGFCDLFDGKVARTKKNRTDSEKNFGIQIDSLTDLVCFGVLPTAICFSMARRFVDDMSKVMWLVPVCALFVLFGMIRLAYFNVIEMERQSVESDPTNKFYWGCPITFSSISLPLAYYIGRFFSLKIAFYCFLGMLILQGIAFVVKIKIPKFKTKGTIVLIAFGVILAISMILLEMHKWGRL